MLMDDMDAVIFDLDGTLADSMWVWTDIDEKFFASRGISIPDTLQQEIEGMSFTETARYFINTFDLPETEDELTQLWNHMALQRYADDVKLKSGALDFLKYLKKNNIRTGIATSNSRLLLDVFLYKNQLKQYFDALTTSDEVKKGKPAPDVYLHTSRKLRTKPNRCFVLEDLPGGLQAGINAGMTVCGIDDEYSVFLQEEKKKMADYYVSDFYELNRLFGNLAVQTEQEV